MQDVFTTLFERASFEEGNIKLYKWYNVSYHNNVLVGTIMIHTYLESQMNIN